MRNHQIRQKQRIAAALFIRSEWIGQQFFYRIGNFVFSEFFWL